MTLQVSETNTKRMKHLFLMFLKQFDVNEYKSLMQFLQLITEKYNLNPSKLYGFLTNQSENDEDEDDVNNSFNDDEYANTYRNRPTLLSSSRLAQIRNKKLKFKNSLSSNSSLNIEYKTERANETQSISSFSYTDSNSSHSSQSKDMSALKSDFTDENQFQKPNDCFDESYETDSFITDSSNKDTSNSLNTSNTSSSALLNEMFANSHEMINSFAIREETNSINDYESNHNEENEQTLVDEINYEDEQYLDQDDNDNNNKVECAPEIMNYSIKKEVGQLLGPKARIRKFSEATRHELEKAFLESIFISGSERCELATRLNLTERQVQKWFVHRREKLRKLEKKAALNSTSTNELNETEYSVSENFIQKALNEDTVNQSRFNQNDYLNETDYNQEISEQNQYVNSDNYDPEFNETDNYYNETQYEYNSDDNIESKPAMYETKPAKSSRRLFPPEVITHLESVFDTEKYLKENQVEEISRVTNLSEKQIRSWFKQRRYRYNQENKKNGNDTNVLFKKRDSLSQVVVYELEKAFMDNNYIYGENKKSLCRKLNLKPIQLERWFYYRRKKDSSTDDINNEINETF